MQVREIMTKNLEIVPVDCTVFDAAKKMKQFNIGVLPIGDKEKVVGILTDRDITVQAVAAGLNPQECKVQDIMSKQVETIMADSNVEEASQRMADQQIRRLVVVDQDQKPIGMLSLGDISTKVDEEKAGEALQEISEPSRPMH